MSVCLIPARGGSRRVPRKNCRPFYGRPILCYAIENAQRVCSRVIVTTEDAEIAQLAKDLGCEVHQRSFDMARDEVGTQAVAQNVLQELKINRERVLVLYPCTPLVNPSDIDEALGMRGYVVAVGSSPLRDAGAFYAGDARAFRDGVPLYNRNTRIIPLIEEDVCDINTEEDWFVCESRYGVKHHMEPVHFNPTSATV